jgi:long-chain acyl-CoA synthetase
MLFNKLDAIWEDDLSPFLKSETSELTYRDIRNVIIPDIANINPGDVVALIGDFNEKTIATFLNLVEKNCVIVPLTKETKDQHSYFLEQSCAQYVFDEDKLIETRNNKQVKNTLIDSLRLSGHPGLILFTSGSTGKPKAILHDFLPFIQRYSTPRPSLRSLSFLVFDHIGGLNTMLHMLFNKGQICSLKTRRVTEVLNTCKIFNVELLPTTPTFLRMLSFVPELAEQFPDSVKIISYGTERMDQETLSRLVDMLPHVSFRQTYGMSELGILRIKSLKNDSLYMKVGGEGVETKIVDNVLYIRSKSRMLGYLNAPSPFDEHGWYCTNDIVEVLENNPEYIRITGRDSEIINVGGLKFMASEVESVALAFPQISLAKVISRDNPITGRHVELLIQTEEDQSGVSFDLAKFKSYLKYSLQRHMLPLSIKVNSGIVVSHRFKKL